MQPQRLRLKNFGPFIDETVDFSDLTETPLFLISGKTGAGKTTIFDGMTYALFGETSGRLRSGKEMRSLFATPEEETSVTFSFKHQQFIYEITRKPEQELAKRKGTGTKKQAAKVSLTIFDQEGKEKRQFTKRTEVDQLITELLHLDAKQFSQIVLLPQGEFRNFLVSPSKEKEIVLRNLFGTQIFQQFNERLKEQAKQKQKELNHLEQELAILQKQFVTAEEREAETAGIEATLLFWQEEQALLQTEIAKEKEQAAKLQKQQKQLESLYYQGKTLNTQLEEKQALLAKQEKLDNQQKEAEETEKWLENYTFAQKWAADIRYWQTSREECDKLKQTQEEQAVLYEKNKQALEKWELSAPERETMRKALAEQTSKLQHLQSLLPLVKEKQTLQQELAANKAKQEQAEQEKNQQKEQAVLLQKEQEENSKQLAQAETLQTDQLLYEQLKYQKSSWEKEKQWLKTQEKAIETAQREIQKRQEEAAEKQEKLSLQTEKVAYLKSEWAKQQIAKLQLLLIPGEPCPVCGSREHPKTDHGTVEDADIRLLEENLAAAETEMEQLIQTVGEATAYLQKLAQEAVKLQENLDEHQLAFDKLQQDLQNQLQTAFAVDTTEIPLAFEQIEHSLAERKQQLETAQKRKEELSEEIAVLEKKIKAADQQKAGIAEQQQRILGKLDTLEQQLDGVDTGTLESEIEQLERSRTTIEKEYNALTKEGEQLRQNVQLHQNKQENLAKQQIDLQQKTKQIETKITAALSEQTYFKEFSEITTFAEKEAEYQQKQTFIRTHQEEQLIITSRLTQLEEIGAAGEQVDLASLKTEKEQLAKQIEESQEMVVKKQERHASNQQVLDKFLQSYEKSQEQLAQLSELQQLSQVINGENSKKISLERYVLQVYLTEVLQTANGHLQQLTKNRYQFELANEIGSYRGSTGLEINVYDDEAGMTRSAHTLSGGESFIAALSLALALAEVIQSQAGGVSIEALFIDEGFGSLDEEALEMAIEALETIESQGRMIGIISHVRELKERIPQQIRIGTEGSGQSKIRYHLG
jgi:exonuclease SbcC